MVIARQRGRVLLFSALGVGLIALAIALNVGWVVLPSRSGVLVFLGVVCFAILIAGVALNTVFLVREIRRNEQHDAFINAVTHELKTPVASIRLYLQTLKQREVEPEKQREFIDTMLADSDRLQSTIDQVLLAGKTGSSKRPRHRADVDVGELVSGCVEHAGKSRQLPAEALEFTEHGLAESPAIVWGDPEEIEAAVTNLIDNAIKYSGETVQVFVEVGKLSARKVAIRVRDKGAGITGAQLKRVFKRFYRIPGRMTTRIKGTGLGLSIVRAVAKRHGGRAYVESEGAGKGSCFTLELPLKSV